MSRACYYLYLEVHGAAKMTSNISFSLSTAYITDVWKANTQRRPRDSI